MPSSARIPSTAQTPEELHAIIQDAINRTDLDAFLDAHDDDATVVVPPDGLVLTHGRWQLTLTEHGVHSELRGLGTMVSRRRLDGSWRIVLDDPFSCV